MIIRNTIIAFSSGVLVTLIVCFIFFYNMDVKTYTSSTVDEASPYEFEDTSLNDEIPVNFDNPLVFSEIKTDHHGMIYTALYLGKIARSVDAEMLSIAGEVHFYNSNPMVPDWGYYADATPDKKEKFEYTSYYKGVYVQNIMNYLYSYDNDLIESQAFAYMRLLRQVGYERIMTSQDGVIFHKDEWYIMLSQKNEDIYNQICISISDALFGI